MSEYTQTNRTTDLLDYCESSLSQNAQNRLTNFPSIVFIDTQVADYHRLAAGIDDLEAKYITALPKESDSYSVEGSGLNTGTVFNHNFRVGTENDLVLSSFSTGGKAYNIIAGFDQVNLNRDELVKERYPQFTLT